MKLWAGICSARAQGSDAFEGNAFPEVNTVFSYTQVMMMIMMILAQFYIRSNEIYILSKLFIHKYSIHFKFDHIGLMTYSERRVASIFLHFE